jgi:serine/threonine-protein kinase
MVEQPERLSHALADRYTVEHEVGRGGMATVYLAHDLRHDRKVAIKVLHAELAAAVGADRFLAEIKVTANLQHPHILPLFDSGEAAGHVFYVMPFVEGESLRDKLERERQLPVEEAISITADVADALHYAHRHDVIHRDIKPGNILLQEGRALVADFGIALAVSAAESARLTQAGVPIGTPRYMSPEQAKGERTPDARGDLYSLGCVLYEMLTGEAPHTGETVQEVLLKKLTQPPSSVRERRDTVPAHVEAALAKVLAKLPADRFRTAEEFKAALTNPSWAGGVQPESAATANATNLVWRRRFIVAAVATTVAVVTAVAAYLRPINRSDVEQGVAVGRWMVQLPDSAPLAFVGSHPLGLGRRALDISPDGSLIAFSGQEASSTKLYIRPIGAFDSSPVAGTEGAYDPFFSPDGEWVAFFAGDELKKVALSGGAPVSLARAANPTGGTWTEDGWIVFGVEEGQRLLWVPENGGSPEQRYSENSVSLEWSEPQILPGGETMLYTYAGRVRGLFLDTGKRVDIVAGTAPRYADSGYLLYTVGGQLLASPFDPGSLRTIGPPFPVLDDLHIEWHGAAHYEVAANGTLVYASGTWAEIGLLVWVDGAGAREFLPFDAARYGRFELSPDGQRLAVSVGRTRFNILILDLETGRATRLTSDDLSQFPLWSSDGQSVAFQQLGDTGIHWKRVDSGEPAELLAEVGASPMPTWWSADGSTLLVDVVDEGSWSIYQVSTDAQPRLEPFLSTGFNEWGAVLDPRGDWVAYTSDEPGRFEVFVEPYPRTGRRWQVSTDGGEEPYWAMDGGVLYYRSGTRLMSVPILPDSEFRAGVPELFVQEDRWLNVGGRSYVVSPDGARSLIILSPEERTVDRLNVVENWFQELRRLAAKDG